MQIRIATLILSALVLPAAAQEAMSLDELIDNERFQLKRTCSVAELRQGFMTRVNVNGDGLDDVLLDFGAVDCDGIKRRFCSDSGCRQAIYLQTSLGVFSPLWRMDAINISFDRANAQWPSFVIELPGTDCKLTAAETCLRRFEIRNGQARQTDD